MEYMDYTQLQHLELTTTNEASQDKIEGSVNDPSAGSPTEQCFDTIRRGSKGVGHKQREEHERVFPLDYVLDDIALAATKRP